MFTGDNIKMKPFKWESELPRERIDIDYARHFVVNIFVAFCYYSKWL